MTKFIGLAASFVALAAVALSCSKSESVVPSGAEDLAALDFSASLESVDAQPTKAFINDWQSRTQSWEKDDAIALFPSGEIGAPQKFVNVLPSGVDAKFCGQAALAASYTALYPYQENAAITAEGKLSARFPSTQTVLSNGVDPSALVGIALSDGGNRLNFRNVFGLVKFDITSTDVTTVILEGNNDEVIAGEIEITPGKAPSWTAVKGERTIVLSTGDGKAFARGTYAVAVLPQTFEKGIRLILKKSGQAKCSVRSVKTSVSVGRSAGVGVPAELFVSPSYKYYYILGKDDLDAWNADGQAWSSTDVVYLGADIDYGKARWEKVSKDFSGVFDGRNHRIYNIYGVNSDHRAGFFHQVSGTVRNVCFGSSDYDFSKDGAAAGTFDGFSYFTVNSCAAASSWYYGGLVAYLQKNGVIENVVNFCSIISEITESSKNSELSYHRIGGIAGTMKGSTTIRDCVNYGSVTNSTVKGAGTTNHIGGIVSCIDGEGSVLLDCENWGEVTNNSPYVQRMGGVIGASISYASTIDRCRNHGPVTNNADVGATLYAGGIIGQSNKSVTGRSGYTNDGPVTNNGVSSSSVHLGGVIGACNSTAFSLTDAENAGAIVNTGAATSEINLGGIIGYHSYGSTLSALRNSGNVSNEARGENIRLGGITGLSTGEHTYRNCCSGGSLTNSGGGAEVFAGGIAGFVNNANYFNDCTVEGCSIQNRGAITGTANIGGVVGKFAKGKDGKNPYCKFATVRKDVTLSNSAAADSVCIGGIVGQSSTTISVSSSTAEAAIGFSGGRCMRGGMIFGKMYSSLATLVGVGGSISGEPLTSSSWIRSLCGEAKSTSGVITDGGQTSCYLVGGSKGVSGRIKWSDGSPAAGIAVSDGFSVVSTDSDGCYSIDVNPDAWHIFFSYPSDAKISKNSDSLPDFFTRYSSSVSTYNFTLTRQAVENEFALFAMADPQAHYKVRGSLAINDVDRFTAEAVPAFNKSIAASAVPCYGVTLGDIVFSSGSRNSNPGMTKMRTAYGKVNMPVFQTMGNHDYTYFYTSTPLKADASSSTAHLKAQRSFEDCFGPINYSFNRGKTHVVCMRDIIYNSTTDASDYHAGFTQSQVDWLRADLALVPADYMVILCVHIPLGYQSASARAYYHIDDVFNMMKRFPGSRVFSGHTHYMRFCDDIGGTGIVDHIHSAVCGNWWVSKIEGDGCPNGYTIYNIRENTVTNAVLYGSNPELGSKDFQLRIYRGNLTTGGANVYFKLPYKARTHLINVFNGDPRWKVRVYENGVYAGCAPMMEYSKYSVSTVKTGATYNIPDGCNQDWWAIGYNLGVVGNVSTSNQTVMHHMWRWDASSDSASISVEVTDPYGNVYTCSDVISAGFKYPDMKY